MLRALCVECGEREKAGYKYCAICQGDIERLRKQRNRVATPCATEGCNSLCKAERCRSCSQQKAKKASKQNKIDPKYLVRGTISI